MRLRFGPVLYIGQCEPNVWRFFVGVLVEGAPPEGPAPLSLSSGDRGVEIGAPSVAADFSALAGAVYWRWPVAVQREEQERFIAYRLEASLPELTDAALPFEVRYVAVPARGCLPRFLFFSCNGLTPDADVTQVPDLNALWKQLYRIHLVSETGPWPAFPSPYHLLIGGGDQVYADKLWEILPELYSFSQLSDEDKRAAQPSESFFAEVLRGYIDTYVENWGTPARAAVFARVPGLYTWDDHDIFDNWGSYGDEMTRCPYYQTIYRAAALCFEAFQMCGANCASRVGEPSHYLQAASFHEASLEVDFLCLDLRSGRGQAQVLSAQQHADLRQWLDRHAQRVGPRRHLLVVSSIPFVYMTFEVAERALQSLPDDVDMTGDLRDQWEHAWHRAEREQLLLQLLAHSHRADCQVTVLSGDVHIAGHGRVVSVRPEHRHSGHSVAVIDQIISSGIVHPAPSEKESLLVEATGDARRDSLAEGVITELLPADPEARYLWVRNCLLAAFEDPPDDAAAGYRGWLLMRMLTETGPQPQILVDP